ncbi:hypothetical protein H6P81_001570 [Aristolochia fimbriata]|uniref:Alpha/beta hydrolase fold-3 domain-containing protein n=1 Tax=Aristolochia fimbriata TaxID=158543 RepID=A0AAV7FAI5_ARIFI|nr:hypothetical protein H6P81_001570 [Aristolochia fimbriata]
MEMKKICFALLVVAMVATTVHAAVPQAHAPAAHIEADAHAPVQADAVAHAPGDAVAHGPGGAAAPGPAGASGSITVAPFAGFLGASLLSLIAFYFQCDNAPLGSDQSHLFPLVLGSDVPIFDDVVEIVVEIAVEGVWRQSSNRFVGMLQEESASQSLPWKTRISMALISAMTDACRRSDGTVNRRLINFFDVRARADGRPVNGVKTADFTVDGGRGIWVRLFVPVEDSSSSSSSPVIVFFHGGGFAFLSAASKAYDAVCRRFARKLRAVVVSVEYRLSPEHPFPAQYDDGSDALRWVGTSPDFGRFAPGADLGRVFLAGDSAGGNIAHHVAARFCRDPAAFPALRVAGLVSIQPFFGGEQRTESETRLRSAVLVSVDRTDWLWNAFLPAGSGRSHPAAYPHGPDSTTEMAGLDFPATLVFVGGLDPLQDWQRKYAGWLRDAGKDVRVVEYKDAVHAFYVFPELPQTSLLFGELEEFVKRQSARSQAAL